MILAMDNGSSILISCIVIAITIGLGILIFWGIRKNLKHFKEEKEIIVDNAIPKTQMIQLINKHIKKVGSFGAASFLYVDLDSFSDLNELFGTKACDEILREMATRIIRILPYKASLTRYTDDEFLVFIRDEDNQLRNEKLCKQILD
ncbi:MAG: diguanylate cyclase, partial [Anaeroplasmataceae bacterium]|nr:diguanylate cyclase [Anaeroplasmataceae bacterium]